MKTTRTLNIVECDNCRDGQDISLWVTRFSLEVCITLARDDQRRFTLDFCTKLCLDKFLLTHPSPSKL